MSLLNTYEEYTKIQKNYVEFIKELFNSNLTAYDEDYVTNKLSQAKNDFENLMVKSDEEQVDSENIDNLKDLKYLIVDALFLSSDLLAFYQYKEVERFKMRVNNYLNKLRRAEMFKDSNCGSCRVDNSPKFV